MFSFMQEHGDTDFWRHSSPTSGCWLALQLSNDPGNFFMLINFDVDSFEGYVCLFVGTWPLTADC